MWNQTGDRAVGADGDGRVAPRRARGRLLLGVACVALGAVVAGCGVRVVDGAPAHGGGHGAGWDVAAGPAGGVTVQATGTVDVVPDAVAVRFTVFDVADRADTALAAVADTADAARAAIGDAGVAAQDVSSVAVSVNPEYVYEANAAPVLHGWRASQSFSVLVRDASAAGGLVETLAAIAGGRVTVDAVQPTVTDPAAAASDARAAAVADAERKAADYADQFDVRLGPVVSIVELAAPQPIAFDTVTARPDGVPASVQVDPGTVQVTVTIEVRWALGR